MTQGVDRDHAAITIAVVGDCIIARHISSLDDVAEVRRLLSSADVSLGNLESAIVDVSGDPRRGPDALGQMWIVAPPGIAEDLRAMGLDGVARANNHATDWGAESMFETGRALELARVAHAGAGQDLDAARAPAFLQTSAGQVAFVSVATTGRAEARATRSSPRATAHPGVSAIATTREVLVTSAQLELLRRIQAEHPSVAADTAGVTGDAALDFFGVRFASGPGTGGYRYRADPADLREFVESVRQCRAAAALVIVSIHAHEPGNWSDRPADFLQSLAREAIDAGASAVFGHGPHRIRGIELYRGRPILYSLGNFVFQADALDPAALEAAAELSEGLDPSDVSALMKLWTNLKTGSDRAAHRGLLAAMTFSNGQLCASSLVPLDLSGEHHPGARGLPRVAAGAAAQSILEEVQQLSLPFMTKIRILKDTGEIVL